MTDLVVSQKIGHLHKQPIPLNSRGAGALIHSPTHPPTYRELSTTSLLAATSHIDISTVNTRTEQPHLVTNSNREQQPNFPKAKTLEFQTSSTLSHLDLYPPKIINNNYKDKMATATLCRTALRRTAAPITLGLSTGLVLAHRQHQRQPMRLDALSPSRSNPPATSRAVAAESEDWLDPELIRQLSGGSLAGFLSGLVVSVFSKTLVLLTGLAIVTVQLASRWGVDLLSVLKIRQRIESSRVLSALEKNPTFKLAFGTTFALAAFMHF